jgi:hypothetical protein
MDYDWWLDNQLYQYDKERERNEREQLEQQRDELGETESDCGVAAVRRSRYCPGCPNVFLCQIGGCYEIQRIEAD